MRMGPDEFWWRNDPEWYRITPEGDFEMTEKAPPEAIKSFEEWKRAWGV